MWGGGALKVDPHRLLCLPRAGLEQGLWFRVRVRIRVVARARVRVRVRAGIRIRLKVRVSRLGLRG